MARVLSVILACFWLTSQSFFPGQFDARRVEGSGDPRLLAASARDPSGLAAGREIPTTIRTSVPEFKGLLGLIRGTLSHDKVEFAGKTGVVAGFAAGTSYPQIWLRDAATVIPASKYFYPAPYLVSWLEEHLALQRPDGSLFDWFNFEGKVDKNTTETDQEASAVLAAAQAARIVEPGWLDRKIDGVSVIDRLDRALKSVFAARFDKSRGLVIGAHTADWGDVDMEDADRNAIYNDARTNWTADIYDQAIVYGACRALAELWEGRGAAENAAFWRKTAEALRGSADRHLWQEDKGYYRVHIHLGSLKHDFDEDAIFPMGGNAEAVLRGLASEEKARRIIETAMARQIEHRMPAVSAGLLPPYPAGVFKHPAVDQPFEYQNGGLWDWFGAKLVYAMFEHGYAASAREKLLELARKNIASNGLYEWDAPDGTGRGSPFYAGSAGSLALALFEGYFGIKLTRDGLELSPRLGEASARIHVRIPAAGVFAAYDYRWLPAESRISLRYESSIRKSGFVRLTLPPSLSGTEASAGGKDLAVKLDGRPVPFSVERLNRDVILQIETDFSPHSLDIRLRK